MAESDIYKGLSTQKIKNLLNKEDQEMANVKDMLKRREESEDTLNENVAVESTDIPNELDTLLEESQASEQASSATTNNFSASAATSEFVDSKDAGNSTGKDGQSQKDIQAKRDRILRKNSAIQKARAELIANRDLELTPNQAQYQAACKSNFVLEALIYENGPKVRLNLSRKAHKDKNTGFEFKPGVDANKMQEISRSGVRGAQLFDYVESTASIAYGMSAPTKLRGGIVTIPAKLNVPPVQLKNPDFMVPTQEEISSSDTIVVVANTEQLFYYIACCCGGTIDEGKAVKSSEVYKHTTEPVKAEYKITYKSTTNGAEAGKTSIKPYFHVSKRKLALKENVIPFRTFKNTPLANMSEADKRTLEELMSTKFKRYTTDSYSAYETLDTVHKPLVTKENDDYKMNFLYNPDLFAAAGLKAIDWGTANYQKDAEVKIALSDYPMPVYSSAPSSKDPNKTSYTYQSAVLGSEGNTLRDLANTYPAAARALELGVTDAEIADMVRESKAAESAAKRSSKSSNKLVAEPATWEAAKFSAFFLDNLVKGQSSGDAIDPIALRNRLNAVSYKH